MNVIHKLLAATAVVAGLAGYAGAADAKVKVFIGVGDPNYYDPYGAYGYYDDGHRDRRYRDERRYDDEDRYGRLSCRQVRRELRARGWRQVEAQDCEGRVYTFTAWRRGEPFELRVRARDGRIVDRNPL